MQAILETSVFNGCGLIACSQPSPRRAHFWQREPGYGDTEAAQSSIAQVGSGVVSSGFISPGSGKGAAYR